MSRGFAGAGRRFRCHSRPPCPFDSPLTSISYPQIFRGSAASPRLTRYPDDAIRVEEAAWEAAGRRNSTKEDFYPARQLQCSVARAARWRSARLALDDGTNRDWWLLGEPSPSNSCRRSMSQSPWNSCTSVSPTQPIDSEKRPRQPIDRQQTMVKRPRLAGASRQAAHEWSQEYSQEY